MLVVFGMPHQARLLPGNRPVQGVACFRSESRVVTQGCKFVMPQSSVDFVDGVVRVTIVLLLVGTTGGAVLFESPNEADLLPVYLWDFHIMAVCHLGDASVTGAAEAFHEA